MKLTVNQQKAIDDKSGTLLISAGAGSGKTAVLTRRICERVSDPENGHDISEYLIVTFTKAATAELKTRLAKVLTEEAAKDPSNKYVLRQLTRIGLAKIYTIHAFCLDLVRTNFQLLGLPSRLRMADDAEAEILCRAILDNIIEDRYSSSENDSSFIKAAEMLSGTKSDKAFTETLFSLYKALRTHPSPFGYLDKSIEMYSEVAGAAPFYSSAFGKLCVGSAYGILDGIMKDCKWAIDELKAYDVLCTSYAPAFESDMALLERIKDSLGKDYESTVNVFSSGERTRLKAVRNYPDPEYLEMIKGVRDGMWKQIAKLREKFFFASANSLRKAAEESVCVLNAARTILCELDKQYSVRKAERGLLDYSDLEHYALRLLVDMSKNPPERTPLAKKYAEGLAEIYIDEYQDVNPLQDLIFKAISSYDEASGGENNRFLVGDLKQSIYRFRGAKPEIFSGYIKKFPLLGTSEADEVSAHKLYLSDNFRCSENVIKLTNCIFSRLMVDYGSSDSLVYSKVEEKKITAPCELVLVLPEIKTSLQDNDTEDSEDIDIEAYYVAEKIKSIVGNKKYLNEKGKCYRYGDVAVLTRSANSASKRYRRAFELAGVPLASDAPDDFFSKPEVLLALCLFNTVDNPERDIYTAGLMRSKLFRFTDDELTEIRMTGRQSSFWGCVCAFGEKEGKLSPIGKKTAAFVEKINSYRALSRGMATDSLIMRLYDDTGIVSLISAESPERADSLISLYEYARSYEHTSFRGLSAYLEYLSDMQSVGKEARSASSEDAVTLMSIHRSKGLEFPICFVTALGKAFNTESEKNALVISDDFGLGLKLRNVAGNGFYPTDNGFVSVDTPFRQAIIASERRSLAEEEKRLLYVAMTRARERLYLTAGGRNTVNAINKAMMARGSGEVNSALSHANDCITWLLCLCPDNAFDDIISQKSENDCRRDDFLSGYVATLSPTFDGRNAKRVKTESDAFPIDEELVLTCLKEIKKSVDFCYPHERAARLPAKLTVSQLKKGLIDEDGADNQNIEAKELPLFMSENAGKATGAEKGTALHMFMQFADYAECEKGNFAGEAERLCSAKFITARQKSLLDYAKIKGFFESSLYRDEISKSARVFRERRFNLSVPASDFTGEKEAGNDEFILVQGVIDCFYLNADGSYTLLDFKTDRVNADGGEDVLRERHSEQMRFYKSAVEKMTGGTVKRNLLYSFSLMREVELSQ